MIPADPPKITAAAIRLSDGQIICGKKHEDCRRALIVAGQTDINRTEGFVTSDGEFVDRYAAAAAAFKAGQIKEMYGPLFDLDLQTHDEKEVKEL